MQQQFFGQGMGMGMPMQQQPMQFVQCPRACGWQAPLAGFNGQACGNCNVMFPNGYYPGFQQRMVATQAATQMSGAAGQMGAMGNRFGAAQADSAASMADRMAGDQGAAAMDAAAAQADLNGQSGLASLERFIAEEERELGI